MNDGLLANSSSQLGALGPGLLLGLMLFAAIVGGHAARLVHAPRVIGFLAGGVLLRAALYGVLASGETSASAEVLESASRPLRPIKDLALGMILFTIGGAFEKGRLRAAGRRVVRIGAMEMACTFAFVLVGCGVVAVLTRSIGGLGESLALAFLLAAAAIATAPAATLHVLQEYEAKGSITDTILGLTGMNNVVCIVAFHAAFLALVSLGVIAAGQMDAHVGLSLLATTIGSVGLGCVCGLIVSVSHARLALGEALLVFFALFVLLGAADKWLMSQAGLSYNFLLTALATGAVFANVGIDATKLNDALRTMGAPIFATFFVMAGFDLHLGELSHLGILGGVYVAARLAGKHLGCRLGVQWVGEPARAETRLGGALLCQAAVVIGLASFVTHHWQSELAHRFSTVILGSVAIFELMGPLLLKRCVVLGGEVKAITLLRRVDSAAPGRSVLRVTLQSLGRLVGWGAATPSGQSNELTVEHLMRTNVELIPASATFDEVLHAIERSSYSDFPVVHEGRMFAGMIHYQDIREVIYDPTMRNLITAVDLADQSSPVATTDMTLDDLLDVFDRVPYSVLAVSDKRDERHIVGIVDQRDLLKVLHKTQRGK